MCQPHLIKYKNLHDGNSNIKKAGLGLFVAHKAVPRNRIITPYTGTESKEPINGNYVLEVTKIKFINADRSIDTVASLTTADLLTTELVNVLEIAQDSLMTERIIQLSSCLISVYQ